MTCEKYNTNYVYQTKKSLKFQNRGNHKIVLLNNGRNIDDDIKLNTQIMDSVTTDGCFTDL